MSPESALLKWRAARVAAGAERGGRTSDHLKSSQARLAWGALERERVGSYRTVLGIYAASPSRDRPLSAGGSASGDFPRRARAQHERGLPAYVEKEFRVSCAGSAILHQASGFEARTAGQYRFLRDSEAASS
jgi:hypothetical protein